MAFSTSTGIYTNPTGAENAAPGQVIRSATWNTINISYATALTQLAQWSQTPTIATKVTNYTIATTDAGVIINSNATVTLGMPAPASFPGRWLRIKSTSLAVVASSTVIVPLATTVAGVTIVASTKWAQLVSDGTNWVVMAGN
jgi:hypothetical protein